MSSLTYLNTILSDGKLKPASKTKNKSQNLYQFDSPYIFFNTIPKTKLKFFIDIGVDTVGFVFDQKILLNRQFYTNKNHSAGNTKTSKKHRISSNKELTQKLYALYAHSHRLVTKIKMQLWILSVFQEVFTRVEPFLNEAKYIILPKNDKRLINRINCQYPNITVLFPV
jgi:hypothetical protein